MAGDNYYISDQNGTYFCTFTVIKWIDLFSRIEYRGIIVDALNYCVTHKNLQVFSWVIMTNHIHIIARVDSPFRFSDVLRDFKKFVSKAIIKEMDLIHESRKEWLLDKFSFEAKRTRRADNFKIWQDANHALLLDQSDLIWQKINYIHENPVRAGWVDEIDDYRFSSARDYAGKKGLVEVVVI